MVADRDMQQQHTFNLASMPASQATVIQVAKQGPLGKPDNEFRLQFGSADGHLGYFQEGGPQAQIVHHGGQAYLVQTGGGLHHEEGLLAPHCSKASPLTVQWLADNYENADGVSLPRSTLYSHYMHHCQQEKLEPMNQASFGKLIRSVFYGLRTRRLGTRGNSKYHYYGIRIKPTSVLNQFVEEPSFALRHYPSFHGRQEAVWRPRQPSQPAPTPGPAPGPSPGTYLGESSAALPDLSEVVARSGLDSVPDPDGDIALFCRLYLEHSEAVLQAVVYLEFGAVASLWATFWRARSSPDCAEDRLPLARLNRVVRLPATVAFLRLFDLGFYQALTEVLVPEVLRPIPPALTQSIRQFAKGLRASMVTATVAMPAAVVRVKVGTAAALAHTLWRHTGLSHVAQAARAVLKDGGHVDEMLADLARVDFGNVRAQVAWVCGLGNHLDDGPDSGLDNGLNYSPRYDHSNMSHPDNGLGNNHHRDSLSNDVSDDLWRDMGRVLASRPSLEEWAAWLTSVVDEALARHHGNRPKSVPAAARQLLLQWSFYSSAVVRDLTLRSAGSFGSFHLLRLLNDDYLYFLVVRRVAAALGLPPVALAADLEAPPYGDAGPDLLHQASPPPPVPAEAATDDQVDESADDDEGLEEDEDAACVPFLPVPVVVSASPPAPPSAPQGSAVVVTVPPASAANGVRKAVRVTTFGGQWDQASPPPTASGGDSGPPAVKVIRICSAAPAPLTTSKMA